MESMAKLAPSYAGFTLEGVVSFVSILEMRSIGEQLITNLAPRRHCVIDLAGAKNQDASIFSLLLCWIRFAEKKGLTIKFIAAPPAFLRMQHLFGLEKVWINY